MKNNKEGKLIKRIEERFPNGEFKYIDGFTLMKNKCRFKCSNCGNDNYMISPSVLLDKRRKTNECSECKSNNPKLGKKNFYDNLPKDFTILGTYINNKTPVKVRHECGYTFDFKPNNLSIKNVKNRCPKCNLSNAEKYVAKYLEDHNIRYELQKTFSSCKYSRVTPFDFYLPDKNLLIEIDGKQHYSVSWNDEKEFERLQTTDKVKEDWVVKNEKTLIRFPAVDIGNGKVKVFMLDDVFLDNYFPRDLVVINKQFLKI